MTDHGRLPSHKTWRDLLFPYVLPYLAYVGLGQLSSLGLSPAWVQAVKFLAVGALLYRFRADYHPGRPGVRDLAIALASTPVLLALWLLPPYAGMRLGLVNLDVSVAYDPSPAYSFLRALNSTLWVPLFEELLFRVYLLGLFQAASEIFRAGRGKGKRSGSVEGSTEGIGDLLDRRPDPLGRPPVAVPAVLAATVFFAAGHAPLFYVSAVLYFLITTWLYKKTGSLWVCILIHGMTNLAIAAFALGRGMDFLWF